MLATPSQTVGPFFSLGLCGRAGDAEIVERGSPGSIELLGAVLDGAGVGVPDAMVELWQADAEGRYREDFGWGRSGTTDAGAYSFVTVKPGAIPADDRLQAPHVTLLVFARGLLKPVHTRMYFPDEEEANGSDPLLAALPEDDRRALVGETDGGGRLRFDIRLQGARQTPFFVLP